MTIIEPRGEGLPIKRMKNGEIENLSRLKPEVNNRIEMLVTMEKRRKKYRAEQNASGLLKLAREYEDKHMLTLAMQIRIEAKRL